MRRRQPRSLITALAILALALALAVQAWGAGQAPRSGVASPAASASAAPASPADTLDRQTPRRTMEGFLRETREGDFRTAAGYLNLRSVPASQRDQDGPDLAQNLGYVLERAPTLNVAKIPDDPDGAPGSKPGAIVIADTLYAGEEPVPIALQRERFADGVDRWLISDRTVALVPVVDAAYGPRSIGIQIPAALTKATFLGNELWQWIGIFAALLVAYAIARAMAAALVRAASYFTRRMPAKIDDALIQSARRPLRTVIGSIAYRILLGPLQVTTAVLDACDHLVYTALVLGLTWLLFRALGVGMLLLDQRAARDGYDAFRARRERTQAVLLRRIASITLSFLSGAVILLQFAFVRSVGVSLLASAGVVGVVVGFAAQKSLAAIVGGIQFSVAQPVRMGDQVVVEGHFGDIEEISLTYVVVRLWNKRRLILPITYFLEKPFQSLTRSTTDLVGQVVLKVAHGAHVDALRAELGRICESDPLWDKGTCSLEVIDSDTSSMTLRALVSAADARKLWDLRCNVRERLLASLG
ncbi:MAG: mechanosensitive ion channel family protein [Polyangiaceae bacterium]